MECCSACSSETGSSKPSSFRMRLVSATQSCSWLRPTENRSSSTTRMFPFQPTALPMFWIHSISVKASGSPTLYVRPAERSFSTASLIAAAGKIYATSQFGAVHVVAAADEFEHLAVNEMNEDCLATPAISRGDLFIRTKTRLYCIAAIEPVAKASDESAREPDPVSTLPSPSPSDAQCSTLVDMP